MMQSVCIQVSGKVQDVWFRKYTHEKAIELGVCGTVQNLDNGDVLIHALGSEEQIAALEKWCWKGSPESNVRAVKSEPITAQDFSDFRIIE